MSLRRSIPRVLAGAVSAAMLMSSGASANVPQAHGIVASGQLARQPNSVLLTFLVEDCADCLPQELEQQAIEQITTSLRQETLVNPMEQVGTLMGDVLSPGKMLKQAFSPANMFRGALGGGAAAPRGMHQQMQGMQDMMLDPWVRGLGAADNLGRAGFIQPAAAFYKGCLTSISTMTAGQLGEGWLTDACIDGALRLGPDVSGKLFAQIWDAPYPDFGINLAALAGQGKEIEPFPQIQAVAARGLGKLAGSGDLSSQQYEAVLTELLGLADQKRLDRAAATGVIQGLASSGDPRARPVLKRMARKGKPEEIRPVAQRALAAAFRDEWAIKRLRKDMKKGDGLGGLVKKAKSAAPWSSQGQSQAVNYAQPGTEEDPKYLAASVLLHIGDEEAFEWTNERLEDRNPSNGETDHRPDLVRDLVETGDPRAREILAERVAHGHANEWLLAWMRIGLYELGDYNQIDELAALTDKTDWNFGRGTVGAWYKRLKPLLWEGAKMAAGLPSDTQRIAKLLAGFAFAERDRHLARADERTRRTAQYRWQLADALAESDQPEALPVIRELLAFDDESVRLSAARALIGRTEDGVARLLNRAMELDYGQEGGVSRNPEIHAALLRDLITRFPDHPETAAALNDRKILSDPSVAFMVYAAREGNADTAP